MFSLTHRDDLRTLCENKDEILALDVQAIDDLALRVSTDTVAGELLHELQDATAANT